MSESKPLKTPLDVSLKLSQLNSPEKGGNEHKEKQSCDYRGIVGCLNYLALTSRPDIAHAANLLSCFFLKILKATLESNKKVFTLPRRDEVIEDDF